MGKLLKSDLDAIGWYAKTEGLRPTLSVPPTIMFLDENNKLIEVNLNHLRELHKQSKKRKGA